MTRLVGSRLSSPSSWGNKICSVIALDGGLGLLEEASFQGLEQVSNGVATGRYFDPNALPPLLVHEGIYFALFVVEIIGHTSSPYLSFRAKGSSQLVKLVWSGTLFAMGGVPGPCFHNIGLVIAGGSGVGWVGIEENVSRSDEGRHLCW